MNNKIIAIMKLFKSYLLEDTDIIQDLNNEKCDNYNIDKEALKKRNLCKCKLYKRNNRFSLFNMGKRWIFIKSNIS